MCTSLCIELYATTGGDSIYIGARAYFSERELWSQSIINMSTTEVDVDPVHGRVEVMRDTSWIGWSTPVYPRTALKILKFSVDETITSKRYEDRIEERSHLEKLVGSSKRYRATYARMVCCPRGLITASNFQSSCKERTVHPGQTQRQAFLGIDTRGVKYEDV
jgi:hypothetical protein